MKKIVRLTESDLVRIVKRAINEMDISPNRVQYDKSMRGDEDSFRERRIPESNFNEGDTVKLVSNGNSAEIRNVMFDHDENKYYYNVVVSLHEGGRFRKQVSEDEIELNY